MYFYPASTSSIFIVHSDLVVAGAKLELQGIHSARRKTKIGSLLTNALLLASPASQVSLLSVKQTTVPREMEFTIHWKGRKKFKLAGCRSHFCIFGKNPFLFGRSTHNTPRFLTRVVDYFQLYLIVSCNPHHDGEISRVPHIDVSVFFVFLGGGKWCWKRLVPFVRCSGTTDVTKMS